MPHFDDDERDSPPPPARPRGSPVVIVALVTGVFVVLVLACGGALWTWRGARLDQERMIAEERATAERVAAEERARGEAITRRQARKPSRWARVGEPVTAGEVRVTLLSVRLGEVSGPPGRLEENGLPGKFPAILARVRVENRSRARPLDYVTWRGTETRLPGDTLRDDNGNYLHDRLVPFLPDWVQGGSPIPPGQWMIDVLAWEPPDFEVTQLRLELQADHVGLEEADPFGFEFTWAELKPPPKE